MYLADDGVLIEEHAVASPELGDVLDEDDAPLVVSLETERHTPSRDPSPADLDLRLGGSSFVDRAPERGTARDLLQLHADEFFVDVETSSRGDGVRRRE